MSACSKEEISAVLHAAEILKRNGFSEQINVSRFCEQAGISRKNAYKHKKKINVSVDSLEQKVRHLQQEKHEIADKLELAEKRAREADLYWELRNILVALNHDAKKNKRARSGKRQELINEYNRISALLGLEPLGSWD
jgi:hypothetical protein